MIHTAYLRRNNITFNSPFVFKQDSWQYGGFDDLKVKEKD